MKSRMRIRQVLISQLKPAPYNPRKSLRPSDREYQRIRQSLEVFGLVQPLVWNERTGHVVGGHQREQVLRDQGVKHVRVVVVDLSIEDEKALNLALNKIGGEWDEEKLVSLLRDLDTSPNFDLALTGFDKSEVTTLLDRQLEEHVGDPSGGEASGLDGPPALPVLSARGTPVTKPGDLVLLGRDPRYQHRLLCGDCTNAEQVERLMKGQRATLMGTDPPYLVGYDGTNHPGAPGPTPRTARPRAPKKARRSTFRDSRNKDWSATYGVDWDDADANSGLYEQFLKTAASKALEPRAAVYVWHASKRQAMLEAAMTAAGLLVHAQIIWAKNRPVLTRTWYAWRHEPCLMGWRKGHKPKKTSSAVLSTVWDVDTIPNGDERPDHPTPKPLELFETPMRQHTLRGDICYEPFAGSGTQILAAQRLGRRCFAVEISPVYCDLIVRRFITAAGPDSVAPETLARYMPFSGRSSRGTPARAGRERA